jgi:hypothetical protein
MFHFDGFCKDAKLQKLKLKYSTNNNIEQLKSSIDNNDAVQTEVGILPQLITMDNQEEH